MRLKNYGMALVPICLAAFVFRAVELILAIDPRTGYFTTGSFLPLLFNGFLLVTMIFLCTVLFTKREPKPAVMRLYRGSLTDNIFGIAGAVLLVAAALFGFFRGIADGSIAFDRTLLLSPVLWQLILALLAAVFLIFFVTYPKLSAKRNLWRIMSLSLTAYYVFLLVKNFQDLNVVFSHAFGIYLIAFQGIAAMASINFSKIMARLFGRKSFTLFTCLMAVLMAVRLADTVLYLIPGNPYVITTDLFAFLCDACITVFFLSQMKKLMTGKKRKALPEQSNDLPVEQPKPEPIPNSEEEGQREIPKE